MTKRLDFQTVDAYLDVIAGACPDAYSFCEAWEKYLAGAGWSIDEFEQEQARRTFSTEAN